MVKKYKRRKFFIKKEFQGKLILGCFLLVAGGGLLFNILLGLLSADTVTISYTNNDLQLGQTPFILIKQVLTANWFLLVIGGGFVMLASLLLSHRIAGPLYRFETTLDNMQQGRLDNIIQLRDKDEGKELARKINEFNAQLSQSFTIISQNSKALQILTEQALTLNLPEKEKEQLASLCWSMQEHNRKIRNNCNYFCSRNE
ncbi:MAG: methyl-accepting chemotaxis protein [Desulforhopalus sp.]